MCVPRDNGSVWLENQELFAGTAITSVGDTLPVYLKVMIDEIGVIFAVKEGEENWGVFDDDSIPCSILQSTGLENQFNGMIDEKYPRFLELDSSASECFIQDMQFVTGETIIEMQRSEDGIVSYQFALPHDSNFKDAYDSAKEIWEALIQQDSSTETEGAAAEDGTDETKVSVVSVGGVDFYVSSSLIQSKNRNNVYYTGTTTDGKTYDSWFGFQVLDATWTQEEFESQKEYIATYIRIEENGIAQYAFDSNIGTAGLPGGFVQFSWRNPENIEYMEYCYYFYNRGTQKLIQVYYTQPKNAEYETLTLLNDIAASAILKEGGNINDTYAQTGGVTPEFKKRMDHYISICNDTAAFLDSCENYNGSDLSFFLEGYSNGTEFAQAWEDLNAIKEWTLSNADKQYYLNVKNYYEMATMAGGVAVGIDILDSILNWF